MYLKKRIALKDGICIVPKDWIVVYADDPEDCISAHAVISRNEIKFGIPRFVALSALPYGECVSDDLMIKIYEACSRKYPRFDELFHQQVNLPTGEHYTQELADVWWSAPCFDIIRIPEYLDPDLWKPGQPEYIPPCGAVIYRTK
ncbi:MAG: hypothetical protein LUC60_05370 [Lachnospiraceae bacterium]|nr:hypothetical protein [Lachnospiraceae bacterium]